MLPCLTRPTSANPSGAHRLARMARRRHRRRPRGHGRGARLPSRARSCSPAAAPRPTTWRCSASTTGAAARWCARPSSTTPCSSRRGPRRRVVAVDARRRHRPRRAGRGARRADVTLVSVMLANNEVGTIQPLAEVAEVVRDARPGAVAPHRRRAGLALARRGPAGRAGRPGLGQRPQVRRPEGRRGAGRARRHAAGAPARSAAARSASGAAAPRTWPASWPWPRPRAAHASTPRGDRRRAVGAAARPAGRRPAGAPSPARSRPARRPVDRSIAGTCHLCFAGVESEALLFLLEEAGVSASAASSCASGAMEPSPRAGGHGRAPATWRSGRCGCRSGWSTHRRRRRPGARRRSPRGGALRGLADVAGRRPGRP